MSAGQKSLTEPPKNLKEAIDWVALVGGYGKTGWNGLGKDAELETALKNLKGFTTATNDLLGRSSLSGLVNGLTKRLGAGFLGYAAQGVYMFSKKGIVQNNKDYKSVYDSADCFDSISEKQKVCALIFLGSAYVTYYFVTFLYWACSNNYSGPWKSWTLGGTSYPLGQFMSEMGFNHIQLDGEKYGTQIAELLEADACFEELKNVHNSATSFYTSYTYSEYLEKLNKKHKNLGWNYPLIGCYRLANCYFSLHSDKKEVAEAREKINIEFKKLKGSRNDDYKGLKQKISEFLSKMKDLTPTPAPLPLHSRSTPAPLPLHSRSTPASEAIDWILRVTGKDGGSGGDSSQAINGLSKQVKELFQEVKESDSGLSAEIGKVIGALDGGRLITKLGDGLQRFIGYDPSGGTIKHKSNGIGASNDPLERLQDGILKFISVVLEGFAVYSGQKYNNALQMQNENGKLTNAASKIKGAIGRGKDAFEGAITQAEGQLSSVNSSAINKVWDAVKRFNKLKGKANSIRDMAPKASEYLTNVLDEVTQDSNVRLHGGQCGSKIGNLKTRITALLDELKNQTGPIDGNKQNSVGKQIDGVENGDTGVLKQLYNAFGSGDLAKQPVARVLVYASYNATVNFMSQLQSGYKSHYQGAEWLRDTDPQKKCAKIFLACLPLIFSNLQQLYWKCNREKAKGGWKEMLLNGSGRQGTDLKHFMDLMTSSSGRLNGTMTGDNVRSVMNTSFTEFANAASATSTSTYGVFLKNLMNKATDYLKAPTNNPLSALFYCSKVYFQGCQAKLTQTRAPSSIREMLYWLAGLQFAPGYSDFEKQIDSIVKAEFKVAISGSTGSDEKLTPDQVTEYLVTTCLHAQTVFSTIQAPRISNHPYEPWLHSLYSNAEFNFTYPSSGTALLYTISNYIYALQFQFQFLYKQCEFDYENGCGWWLCKFGSNVFPKDDTTVPSSFCGSVKVSDGSHDGNKCGLQTQYPSPLQAFLTDTLTGFRRDPSDPYSHLAECTVGSMCHVPMGFKPENFRDLSTGGHLMIALNFFCSKPNTPLPKLCHTLSCVTKRTPRTLSDVFGFTFHLTGQMFHTARTKDSDPTSDVDSALARLVQKVPDTIKNLFYDITDDLKEMGRAFFDLSLHCHKVTKPSTVNKRNGSYCDHHNGGTEKAADLASLSGCTNGNTCGKYLEPLGISYGATFADNFASTYLTWALYLTDDIYESFQGFLDRFSSLKCTGCKNDPACNSHASGEHSSQCKCPSIVQCADALTVLYEYGFHFQDAFWLKGWSYNSQQSKWNRDGSHKKTCKAFAGQLQSVISGNQLASLLTSIDDFLFLFRYYFLSNLSGFWAIYVCIILYTFFFLLDTLHLRSHLKLSASHTLPTLALLTSGKPLPVTKLTYITQ
ncbi:variant erythrocyte surface antigen-1 family protein [Babesia caballi]|uniref:Variant erythrocyte surface antigen-1 family protein n=1 Tax=Babesia caballi TaxID=5871 RepID=A0AAV4LWU2_BABCB|nr:variant erythrocyte surface antigen-1 family protein [Babesia caballi]